MSKSIIFKKSLINDKNELLEYKDKIFELFLRCFDRNMDQELWQWAYIKNPNGNPIVSLYFDKDKLIGHYAFIPVSLIYKQKKIKAVLSMTTMIDFKYRKYGIFKSMAEETNQKAIELDYKLVYGFPNKQAAPGLKKRLDWVLEEDLYVANLSYDELQQIEKKNYNNSIFFNTQDKENLEWRLNKPNQNYFKKDENILKKFNDNFDIVYNNVDFSSLEKGKKYNLLLDHDLDKYLDKKEFDYIFGYKLFDTSLQGIEFKKDLIMSDVF
ncbi:GNAT family N-acetyltransferase [Aliarcobacter cryaerophilus]|uniref:GNAT family N-acetyltransferase n=1 Tax=Aliarcobacter cryaerophilus TaxID=28198 RepID=UPI000826A1C2|nr:GNAT family N-acetyltransferase [Aliarcobacter cryaerophilus]